MNQPTDENRARHPYLWLGIATLLFVFSNGRWILPIAAWLAPVFMLRFLRTRRTGGALLLGYLGTFGAALIYWTGMVPVPAPLYALIALLGATITFLPFLIDRVLAHRLRSFASTLVLPVAWVTVEYIHYSLNPLGQWLLIAYSQARNLSLLQLVSVTGVWGISFLIAWFASTVNWAWELDFAWSRIRRGAAIYAGVLAAILLLGQARMALSPPTATTVRVASITASPEASTRNYFAMATDDTNDSLRNNQGQILAIQDTLFARSRREARAGAKLVFWAEANAVVHTEHEEALIERGKKLAREEQIFLLMSLYTVYPGEHAPENKTVTIDPRGVVQSIYHKTMVIIEPPEPGDGMMKTLDTPFGTITSAICFDFSFPHFIRQAGRADVDIALDPSWDWKPIDPYHTWVSAVRAVENGFSLVRQTNDGLSAAVDYQGRVLSRTDHFTAEEPVMVSDVPTEGVTTIYSRIGDSFAWLCVAAFLWLVGGMMARKKQPDVQESSSDA
ncbi:MAG: apolipoprotein N-acyltransferase [bacterium]|nr:apolipoprotein N-acyltransferase [bacterium]